MNKRDRLLQMQQEVFKQCTDIMERKNHDYAGAKPGADDPFRNLKMCTRLGITDTPRGILVRLSDKYARLIAFMDNDGILKVQDEKLVDTIVDSINYHVLLLGVIRDMKDDPDYQPMVDAMGTFGTTMLFDAIKQETSVGVELPAPIHVVQSIKVPSVMPLDKAKALAHARLLHGMDYGRDIDLGGGASTGAEVLELIKQTPESAATAAMRFLVTKFNTDITITKDPHVEGGMQVKVHKNSDGDRVIGDLTATGTDLDKLMVPVMQIVEGAIERNKAKQEHVPISEPMTVSEAVESQRADESKLMYISRRFMIALRDSSGHWTLSCGPTLDKLQSPDPNFTAPQIIEYTDSSMARVIDTAYADIRKRERESAE